MRRIKQGALSPPLTFTVLDSAGSPVNLGAYSAIYIEMRLSGETMVRIRGSVTVVGDGATGQGSYVWQEGDTENPVGTYDFEIHGIRSDNSKPEIIPDNGFGQFTITDAITPMTPIDDSMLGTTTTITEASDDVNGAALSGVPVGAVVTAYLAGEPYARDIASAGGAFSLQLTQGATYTLKAVKLGNPEWVRTVAV